VTRKNINLPGRGHELPFNDAVLAGDTLYLSGRIGFTPGTMKVPDAPADEAHYLLDQFVEVLKQAGMTMDDLVYVQIFCSDLNQFDTFNGVYRKYFKQDFPARAFLGSGPLLFGARFEMIAVAARR
jgi:2-iminobutanoate/2-iminopropanoate deaminase